MIISSFLGHPRPSSIALLCYHYCTILNMHTVYHASPPLLLCSTPPSSDDMIVPHCSSSCSSPPPCLLCLLSPKQGSCRGGAGRTTPGQKKASLAVSFANCSPLEHNTSLQVVCTLPCISSLCTLLQESVRVLGIMQTKHIIQSHCHTPSAFSCSMPWPPQSLLSSMISLLF